MLTLLKKKGAGIIILASIIFFPFLQAQPLNKSFDIAQANQKDLEELFTYLFKETTAGYVLYGNKPVFIGGLPIKRSELSSSADQGKINCALIRACAILKQLKLKNTNYQICITDSVFSHGNQEIRLINKKALLKCIKENLSLFQSELTTQQSPQEILEQILSSNSFDFFKGHIALQGIVLGYGTKNAIAYEKNDKLMLEAQEEGVLDEIIKSGKKIIEVEEKIKDAVITYAMKDPQKWGETIDNMKDFAYFNESDMKSNHNVKIPFSFLAHSKESKKLIGQYIKTEKKVSKILKDKNFVEKSLRKLD